MSIYSGKCDLFDHISGLAGWYDKEGNPVKFGDMNVGAYYSDEYRDFLEFKKRTGGVIHQHKVITVTPWNHEEVKRLCPQLEIIEHKKTVPDKRQKSGQREDTYYTYKYWGKEYTLKELNKHKVYITIDIHFNNILDLIPYYPYIVSFATCSDGKETIVVSDRSYVDEKLEDHLEHGWYSNCWQDYKKELQKHYIKIVQKYFNPEGREHIEEVEFDSEGNGHVNYSIDTNFEVQFVFPRGESKLYWNSPEVINDEEGTIKIAPQNLKLLGNKLNIYYVEKGYYDLDLG